MQPQHMVTCSRCGKEAWARHEMRRLSTRGLLLPEAWEGTIDRPVCPGCQYVEWHPHCKAVRVEGGHGERVDLQALQRGEPVTIEVDGVLVLFRSLDEFKSLPAGEVGWCDYIDLTVSWVELKDEPKEWCCPDCGGTEFEGVHRDYPTSNLKGTAFGASVDEVG